MLLAGLILPALGGVVIDPGHGGYDSGIEVRGYKEKDITLSTARSIAEALKKNGKSAALTRDVDRYLSLLERISITNTKKPEIFISIHLADSEAFTLYISGVSKTEGEAKPADRYALSSGHANHIEQSKELLNSIEKSLDNLGIGVTQRQMRLPVLDSVQAPAVLIEIPAKSVVLTDLDPVARAIANCIAGFGEND